jgi:hypothetical protein
VTGSSEFRLAVYCCATSFRGSDARPRLTAANVKWPSFLELARFHRIEGLGWNALASNGLSLPDGVQAALAEAASAIAAHNLRMAADCRALLNAFNGANIPLLFLKGLPLGALAYANPALKSAIDIDLLIDPADLQCAANLLRSAGYEFVGPRAFSDDRGLHEWHRGWKESVWAKADLQIDLHTRTADNPRLISTIDAHSPRRLVLVSADVELPTLADEEQFAYLAVHGASSAWFRLKWISDFAGFVHGKSAEELTHLYRRSQELGGGRAAGQALLLADELFGTLEGCDALAGEMRRDRSIVSLYRTALHLVTGEPIEPTARRFGTFPIHRTQFQLMPGIGYKAAELSRQAARILGVR